MVKIYLSPSTQTANLYWDKVHNEEQVMNLITDAFVKFLSNYEVEIIRPPRELKTYDRIAQANQQAVDFYLALHSNARGGMGCETYYQVGVNHSAVVRSKSKDYATKINRDFSAITCSNSNPNDRGLKSMQLSDGKDYNHELRGVLVPANLIEIEFHDTEQGSHWILANIQRIGETIGKSLVDLFDLKPKIVLSPDEYFYLQVGAYKTLRQAELEASKVSKLIGKKVGIKFGSKDALKWIKSIMG